MTPAPYFHDIACAPRDTRAHWLTTADGLRLRMAHHRPEGARATVLLFPGRTEFVEKYGPATRRLAAAGFATVTLDWRGQGLADRILGDRLGGHVMRFSDYQIDIDALSGALDRLDPPQPFFLLAHSMGGAIGLRAILDGLPVRAAAFSSPMWGIFIPNGLRPLAWGLSWAAGRLGLDHRYAPGTSGTSYPNSVAFDLNLLTDDREMFDWMARQIERHPELALGGPSMRWLGEALRECRALSAAPSPAVPTLTLMGSREHIVDKGAIDARMERWPGSSLRVIEGARHEPLMDTPARRDMAYGAILDHFRAHLGAGEA